LYRPCQFYCSGISLKVAKKHLKTPLVCKAKSLYIRGKLFAGLSGKNSRIAGQNLRKTAPLPGNPDFSNHYQQSMSYQTKY